MLIEYLPDMQASNDMQASKFTVELLTLACGQGCERQLKLLAHPASFKIQPIQ